MLNANWGWPVGRLGIYLRAGSQPDRYNIGYNIEAAPSDSMKRSQSGQPGGAIGIEGQKAQPKPEDDPRRGHGRAGAAGFGLFRRIHGRVQTGVDAEPILPLFALLAAESAGVRE
jgi:hypothetical protein